METNMDYNKETKPNKIDACISRLGENNFEEIKEVGSEQANQKDKAILDNITKAFERAKPRIVSAKYNNGDREIKVKIYIWQQHSSTSVYSSDELGTNFVNHKAEDYRGVLAKIKKIDEKHAQSTQGPFYLDKEGGMSKLKNETTKP